MSSSPDESGKRESRAQKLVRRLSTLYPDSRCALDHHNPFELLAATILSAQCTDARVNLVTPSLFARFTDAHAMAKAGPSEIETLIHSTGFFRAKAGHLLGMAAALVERHGGEVPRDFDALTKLPGVGRKTANVVMGNAFGIASGVVVDTHVKRLCFRLGLTKSVDPETIERELAGLVPRKRWVQFSHWLIEHGRGVCDARRPRCGDCPIEPLCPKHGLGLASAPSPSTRA